MKNAPTELTVGFAIDRTDASKLCKKLDFACEVSRGNFSCRYEQAFSGELTIFTAPKKLSVVNLRIAQALLEGYRVATLG